MQGRVAGRVFVWALSGLLLLTGCSHGKHGGGTGGTGGVIVVGGAGLGGSGASGVGGSGAGTGGSGASGLQVMLLDDKQQPLAASYELCSGKCLKLGASATGGLAPYTYSWHSDTGDTFTGDAPHEVCPKADTTYTLDVHDVEQQVGGEFGRVPLTGSASVRVTLKKCESMPGDPCEMHAASGSFDPVVEWRWTKGNSYITPMVAQLTDDNADGTIDAKDTPDIVVIAQTDTDIYGGSIVVLDGKTGNEHFRIAKASTDAAPALGDIDGDGLIDIVAIVTDPNNGGGLFPMAFDNEGNAKWSVPPAAFSTCVWPAAVAIADLDHDGSPEIITACDVYSSSGQHLWSAPEIATQNLYDSPTAADLDGDDFLEVIFGAVAYKHDGSMFYSNTEVMTATHPYDAQDNGSQFVAIADFDADGQPEIVVSTRDVLFILDHAGKTLHKVDLYMTGEQHGGWAFPPAVADLDADGTPEILISNGISFTAYDAQLKERWSMPVQDGSGIAAGTAFDFLGDGSSEAMYGDETMTWAFAGSDGKVLFSTPRASGTIIEYPTVVDVDNDGSAEVLIVTSYPSDPVATPPGLTVIGDRMGRWVPARRILNQDTYHVTNINDDGTIPKHELPSWKLNNSFRAQAQVNPDGVTCIPRPE